ncbi:MAG: LPXTG cell wall anchor domain-containing protein, partial [Atopobiaceae bacterium]|nr:LPXTG cell wall anchor domain-containing protein [Atopobiaceae bacterium]
TVVSKPANGSYYKEGETVKYKIVVTNTGECDLTDVKVDDELTGDHWVVKKLAAGASKNFTTSYKVTKADVKAGSVLNVVTAEADNPVDPDKPLKDKDDVKVPTGEEKNPPSPPRKKVVPQTGDDTPTGAMALMTVFGAAALTAGTVLKRKRK